MNHVLGARALQLVAFSCLSWIDPSYLDNDETQVAKLWDAGVRIFLPGKRPSIRYKESRKMKRHGIIHVVFFLAHTLFAFGPMPNVVKLGRTISPSATTTVLHESPTGVESEGQRAGQPSFNASWKDISEVPIAVDSKEQFDYLPRAKRIGIVARSSVLHLTLLSCLGPLLLRGALRSEFSSQTLLTPGLAFLWTLNVLSWHAFHNLLNDWQDLEDDDKAAGSFRTDYGCHALKQGFLNKRQFLRLMAMVALPGTLLTIGFRNTVVGPAAPWGLSSLFLYTVLFKPLAMGEILIYLVWGPLMAGYGAIAAGASWTGLVNLFTSPATAQFGLAAFGMIMGKHTDKIERSSKRTLPKLLGYPLALFACGATIIAPHVLLLATFLKERILSNGARVTPTIPLGAGLAFLTLFRELPSCLKILRKGKVKSGKPTLPWGTVLPGVVADFQVDRTWPLWFVAACGWHAATFLYLFVIGSGIEWGGRAILTRIL